MPRVASLWFPTLPTDRLRGRPHRSPPDVAAPPPFVTAAAQRGRRIVAACSVEARAAGVRPGTPLAEARVRIEGLDVAESDPAADATLLARLADHAAQHWTPLVAVDDDDGLLLDVGAAAHLFGSEAALLRRIARTAYRAGLAMRGAVADGVTSARAIARCGAGVLSVVPRGCDAEAVAPLPPIALGLDAATLDALARLGFATVGAIAETPRAPLVRRFGVTIGHALDALAGRRAEPIAPRLPPRMIRARRAMIEPIATPEAIAIVFQDLGIDLCGKLERRRLGVRRALLVCRRVDAHDQTILVGLARPTRDAAHLAELLCRRIEAIDPGFGIETMILAAIAVQPLDAEQSNVLSGGGAAADLALLVDRLVNRFGEGALVRAAAAESDVPTRAVSHVDPLAPPTAHDWLPDWPRPIRLLARPEPVDRFVADLPDHAPAFFSWRGARHRVIAADGPERLHGEWWRGGEGVPVRDYFQVEIEGGARLWLFRRGDGIDPASGPGDWFVHGAFG